MKHVFAIIVHMDFTHVFFDLDGTLTESGPGIMKSVQYMLHELGIEENNEQNLRRFIGPSLIYSLTTFYGLTQEEAARGVKIYRPYYDKYGAFDNSVYSGIPELLSSLKTAGKTLCIASGKPEYLIAPITEHFGIADYFTVLGGSDVNEARADKTEVIASVLSRSGAVPEKTIMVGDRRFDIAGAKSNGMRSVGVLYGYGERTELEEAGADFIAQTTGDLLKLLR